MVISTSIQNKQSNRLQTKHGVAGITVSGASFKWNKVGFLGLGISK
jgi:hypothetical protein